jgi:CelD/BcsL family acetyltransferase involved in cellulose biosynthesis
MTGSKPAPAILPPRSPIAGSTDCHVTVYETWNLPPALETAWRTLAEEYGGTSVFVQIGWFQQWWCAFGEGRCLRILVIDRGREILGIFPCWAQAGADGHIELLHSITSEAPHDFLIHPEWRRVAIAAFLGAVRQLWSGAKLVLEDLSQHSQNRLALEAELASRRTPFWRGENPHAPVIDLSSGSWETVSVGLHSKLKNNIRKGLKRSSGEGEMSFEVIRRPEALDACMSELFEVEFRSWKGREGTAIQCDPRKEHFYRAMAQYAMTQDCLYIFQLRKDGCLIAFDLCVAGGRTMFAIKTGYDQTAAARLSPGNLMRYQVIQYLLQTHQFDRYDFLGRFYPWKMEWTSQSDVWAQFEIFPATLSGRYDYFRRHGWKKPLQRSPALVEMVRRSRAWLKNRKKAQ